MGNQGHWNLSLKQYEKINIYLLTTVDELSVEEAKYNELRLLIISHSLNYQRIPSLYLNSTPKYFGNLDNVSCIIVFDINNRFLDYNVPKFLSVTDEIWEPKYLFTDEIISHFRFSLVMHLLYEFSNLSPIYFTTHIVLKRTHINNMSFLVCPSVVLRDNKLQYRMIIQECEYTLFDYPFPPEPNGFVMLQPYCHPFKVLQSGETELILMYVDQSIKVVDPRKTKFLVLLHSNPSLGKYYTPDQMDRIEIPVKTNPPIFKPKDFSFSNIDISKVFNKEKDDPPEKISSITEYSIMEFPPLTSQQVISELITEPDELYTISSIMSSNGDFPSMPHNLKLLIATFLSFFRFDFGFLDIKPPYGYKDYIESTNYSEFYYERLDFPYVELYCRGELVRVSSKEVIDKWIENEYQPINGSKNAFFKTFYDEKFSASMVNSFITQLCEQYAAHGFGVLKPCNSEPFVECTANDMMNKIMDFFHPDNIGQFNVTPSITFIIGDVIYNDNFKPFSVVSYVRPEILRAAKLMQIKKLAFICYSRIRYFKPEPYGKLQIPESYVAPSLFGYRYGSPFLLPREESSEEGETFILHLIYDCVSRLACFIDSSGTILHIYYNQDGIHTIAKYIGDFQHWARYRPHLTFSLLGEGITKKMISEAEQCFTPCFASLKIFTIAPCSSIQVHFDTPFADDAIIFEKLERSFEYQLKDEYATPQATAFCVSQKLQAYQVSLFSHTDNKSPKEVLGEFVKNMSHLSWLSVKPGCEYRTFSYPPHMAALLRKSNRSSNLICPFVFLPSKELV